MMDYFSVVFESTINFFKLIFPSIRSYSHTSEGIYIH